MNTDAHLDAPTKRTVERADRSSTESTPVRRGHFPWPTLVVLLLGAGLIRFNIWWYRRDTRPVADLKTMAAWMAREQYARAEPALRERLRRAPHDGEARTLLAKVFAARGDVRGRALQQNSQATLH
jgi:hypothetical protein